MKDLLNIQNLSKHYPGFDLTDINLRVPAGSIVGLVGSNGAGKTTTIKASLGIIRPDTGSISLLEEEVVGAPSSKIASLKQQIGVVFDACSFPEELTVKGVGKLMAACYENWDDSSFQTHLAANKLPLDKTVSELSRGMSMKLTMACALSHDAKLLVLDEATAGLDPLARDETLDDLRAFMDKPDRGILMSSHITSDLEKIADYVVCIDEGRVVFSMEKDAITDIAGIAQCRAADLEAIVDSGFFAPGEVRCLRGSYGTTVLVPDRFAFARRFDDITVESATIDIYMNLVLKGEAL